MILNATFAYGAHVYAPRQRNHRVRGFLATIPVEIAEATPDEAPVALRVHEAGKAPLEYRLHGGRLWAPRVEDAGPCDAAWLAGKAGDWRTDRFHTPLATGHRHAYEDAERAFNFKLDEVAGPIDGDPLVAKVKESRLAARAAQVREAAAGYLLVGGALHFASREPVYAAGKSGLEVVLDDGDTYGHHYRADETDAIVAHSRRLTEMPSLPRIEVVVPEAVMAPLPHRLALSGAESLMFMATLGHDDMKAWPVSMFCAYAELRDAVADARARLPEEGAATDMGGVIAAWGRLADAHAAGREARGLPPDPSERASLEKAARRYGSFRGDGLDPAGLAPR